MTYYINKIVGWVLSPLGLTFLGLGVGCALRIVGAKLSWRNASSVWGSWISICGVWKISVSVAFLWVMSLGVTTRFVGVGLERPWEREGLMHGSIEGLPDADAIIVLGGGEAL